MDPFAALIGAGAQLIGGSAANSANSAQAHANRVWQQNMSNNAVQRRVKDLKAAGLNPMLAYGQSASSPGGAQANISNAAEGMASTGLQMAQLRTNLKKTKADTLNAEAATATQKTSAEVNANTALNLKVKNEQDKELLKQIKMQTPFIKTKTKFDQQYYPMKEVIKSLIPLGALGATGYGLSRKNKNKNKIPKGYDLMDKKTGEIFQP